MPFILIVLLLEHTDTLENVYSIGTAIYYYYATIYARINEKNICAAHCFMSKIYQCSTLNIHV